MERSRSAREVRITTLLVSLVVSLMIVGPGCDRDQQPDAVTPPGLQSTSAMLDIFLAEPATAISPSGKMTTLISMPTRTLNTFLAASTIKRRRPLQSGGKAT